MEVGAEALEVSRCNLQEQRKSPPSRPPRYEKATYDDLLKEIRAITNVKASYGYCRVTEILNRTSYAAENVNHKRVYRVMKTAGLVLAKHSGGKANAHARRNDHHGGAHQALVLGYVS